MSEQDFENEILVEDTDRSVSQAEDKFNEVVRLAMVNVLELNNAEMTDSLFESLVRAVVGSLKLDDWFISRRGIHEIQEYDWRDTNFDADEYVVYTNILEEDDE